jgi:molecular chaperone DnaK
LTEIPPAPRGVPQIEVTLDIDANGILHVSAKDKATGKENKIVIKSSSGLSDDEIDKMVRDAEEHAEEDRKARELVDARNQGEAMIHGVKKSMDELGDKLDGGEKSNIDSAIADLEEALKGEDTDAINSKTEALTQASHKMAEQLYAQGDSESGGPGSGGPGAGGADSADAASGDAGSDDVVDAEFEEVDDSDKKA